MIRARTQVALALVVPVAVLAVGLVLPGAIGTALTIGSGSGLVLIALATLLVVGSHRFPLPVAAGAALFSFVIRFGGAGLVAYLVRAHPQAEIIVATLAGCLAASLVADGLLWLTVIRRESAPHA